MEEAVTTETPPAGTVNAEGETITDIQNYLDSFNKEIQDGGTQDGTVAAPSVEEESEAAEETEPAVEEGGGQTTAYFVAQSEDGTHIQTYQYATEQPDGQYQEGTYYTTSEGTYFEPAAETEEGTEGEEATSEAPTRKRRREQQSGEENSESDQPRFVAMQPRENAEGDGEELQMAVTEEEDMVIKGEEEDDQMEEVVPQHQTIRMLVRQPDGTEVEQNIAVSSTGGSTLMTADGQEIHVSDEGTLQMMANLAEHATVAGEDGNNQVILNAGSAYQTVTIVPSDTNPGEVSYVLIVSRPEEKEDDDDEKNGNMDMSVYDFNEGEKQHTAVGQVVLEEETLLSTPTGHKVRTKMTPKKSSQTVTQPHMCNYCNYHSPKRYLLARHMKSHSEERPHKCSVCERGFKTLASLQNHVNTHTGTRPHQCKECIAAFTTSGELVRHVRYKHTHEKPHRCTECDYASVELSKLKRHMRCHTGERPYQCPHCTYASPDTYKLKRHLRIHTGEKPYECDICHARFTQSNSLKAHKLIHSGNKPVFQCELCPTTCGRKTDLRIHVQKLHTSDKPLKCKRCDKSFPDRYSYKVHVKTHEGEKCFKCDLCAYASISQRHLESHMLIHTDQKPYRCDECGQSFRQKQLLKRHINLYHDPNYIPPVPKEKTHECPECGKSFRHKGNLIRHLAVHDPEASAAEKEEAMRIGRPKGPGEEHDGEEDEYLGDEDELEHIQMEEEDEMQEGGDGNEGQQVVVFEVIQLPATDGSDDQQSLETAAALAMAAANGDGDGMTLIHQGVSMANSGVSQVITPSQSSVGDFVTVNSQTATRRRRGRPRKYPLIQGSGVNSVNMPSNVISLPTTRIVVPAYDDEEESPDSRHLRKRSKRSSTGIDEDYDDDDPDYEEPKKKSVGRPRGSKNIKKHQETVDTREIEELQARYLGDVATAVIVTDPEEVARREEEMARKKMEQKEKDKADCFGFNDDEYEDEDESIMTLNGTAANGEDGDDYS